MDYEAPQELTVSQLVPCPRRPPMDTLQGTRSRKGKVPLQAPALGVPQSTERRSLLSRARSNETRRHQSASIHQSNRSNQEQETAILKAILEQALSSESSLREEVEQLETSLAQTVAKSRSLRRENEKRFARAASIESSLRHEIETLKTSLTLSTSKEASLKQEIKTRRSRLVQAASTEMTLRGEIEELKDSLARRASTESRLREKNNVLKTTLTHALTSEQKMRTSARESREEWEQAEKSLRGEIDALRLQLEIAGNDIKGKKVASRVQQTIREKVEDAIVLRRPRNPLEGSSDIHILLDDLALQSLAKDGPNSTPHSTADAFGGRLLPEFNALERTTKGLQQAINSEVRTAYANKWLSSRRPIPQRSPSVARNLRLLVVLWEASGVEELLSSLTSIFGDVTPTMGSRGLRNLH
jgi:myosin heavy subunit